MTPSQPDVDLIPILPDTVPVTMPDLPATLVVTTVEQLRAASDPLRARILGIIQQQPATAKQIATRLDATPGAIGHHLHLLEEAGLAQVVARRLIRGVVAKYYTRTARLFYFDLPPELTGELGEQGDAGLDILTQARNEYAEALSAAPATVGYTGLPHVRLPATRARDYIERLEALVADLLAEPADADGDTYAICLALFRAPAYLQRLDPGDAPA